MWIKLDYLRQEVAVFQVRSPFIALSYQVQTISGPVMGRLSTKDIVQRHAAGPGALACAHHGGGPAYGDVLVRMKWREDEWHCDDDNDDALCQ